MLRVLFSGVMLVTLLSPVVGDELQEIIEKIQEAENRYSNVELRLKTSFKKHDDGTQQKNQISGSLLNSERDIHFVRVEDKFRLEGEGFSESSEHGKVNQKSVVSFDGKTTRILKTNDRGNQENRHSQAVEGPPKVPCERPPYALLPVHLALAPTLSVLIDEEKLNAHFLKYGPYDDPGTRKQVILVPGEMDIQGLRCRKVQIVFSHDRVWGDLFLAIDRGYLPVRYDSYNAGQSSRIRILIVETKSFAEVGPDLWYPEVTEFRRFYPLRVNEDGEPIVQSTESITITTIHLKPECDDGFFSSVDSEGQSQEPKGSN